MLLCKQNCYANAESSFLFFIQFFFIANQKNFVNIVYEARF